MPGGADTHSPTYQILEAIIELYRLIHMFLIELLAHERRRNRKRKRSASILPYTMRGRIPQQVKHMNRLVGVNDIDCMSNFRMDKNTFGKLCSLLRQVGVLHDGKYVKVEEQVAIFLAIIAHHKKNRIVRFDFLRSGQTVSQYVHKVLHSILKLHEILLVKPDPVKEDCTDPRWKWFKDCLGALDGTYINVHVSNEDKPRYRTRKGHIAANTLAVCDTNLKFTYFLPGWEGSAADSRVLRDAINREDGLRVPRGNYYLCDNGYANFEGFLAPYKGVRYHLKEWGHGTERPQNARELFNMRHSKARNIIERAFGIMKMRWGILRSASYYPIKVQNRIIMACFLLHNFIRNEMVTDPFEEQIGTELPHLDYEENGGHVDYVDIVESTQEWNQKRDEIAQAMWLTYNEGEL